SSSRWWPKGWRPPRSWPRCAPWAATSTWDSWRAPPWRRPSSSAATAPSRRPAGSVLRPQLEVLDLAREGIAADPEQPRRLDAAPSRVLQGAAAQHRLEVPREAVGDAGLAAREPRGHLALEHPAPVVLAARRRPLAAQLGRQVLY